MNFKIFFIAIIIQFSNLCYSQNNYSKIRQGTEDRIPVQKDDKWGFIDSKNNLVIPIKFDDVFLFSDGVSLVQLGGKYGYIDYDGKFIIPPRYDDLGQFESCKVLANNNSYGNCNVTTYKISDKLGYINNKGEEITSALFSDISEQFYSGVALVNLNNKWGAIDSNGKTIIAIEYRDAQSFLSKGFDAIAFKNDNNLWGIYNKKGKLISPFVHEILSKNEYELIGSVSSSDEVPPIEKIGSNYQVIKNITRLKLNSIPFVSDPTAATRDKNSFFLKYINQLSTGYFNSKDYVYLKYQEPTNEPFYNNGFAEIAKISNHSEIGLIDKTGKIILEPKYNIINPFHEGLARVCKKITDISYKSGFINEQGKIVIPFIYECDNSINFSEGLCPVKNSKGMYGFIDIKGNTVIPFIYKSVIYEGFKNGIAKVSKVDNIDLIINKHGKVIKEIKNNNSTIINPNRSDSDVSCVFKFVIPKIAWKLVDNRRKCNYCRARYVPYSKVDLAEAKQIHSVQFLQGKLLKHWEAVGASDEHKENDRIKLKNLFRKNNYSEIAILNAQMQEMLASSIKSAIKARRAFLDNSLDNYYQFNVIYLFDVVDSKYCSRKCEHDDYEN